MLMVNFKTLNIALSFFGEVGDKLVIQCDWYAEIPMLVKAIRSILGEPSARPSSNTLKYGRHEIIIISIQHESHMRGYKQEQYFYVGQERDFKGGYVEWERITP